ncbi:MAG TPA: dihydropteroate synthase, partial [Tenuifilaceae bacterium]|nr:dihydropteroate synthase [Tenuifilaceae bacterium]
QMHNTIAKLNVPYIAMHMKGTPQNMQDNPWYDDVIKELFSFFANRINELNLMGINDILIDPGFGFGKTIEHNYRILSNLDAFRLLQVPIVVGLSRKSFIYKPLDKQPKDALNGTTVLNTIALLKGSKILRVHDVKEAVETIKLVGMAQNQVITE